MPSGICTGCISKLQQKEAKKEVSLPDPVDFSQLNFPTTITRSRGGDLLNCDCDICKIASERVDTNPSKFGKSSDSRGRPKKNNSKIA